MSVTTTTRLAVAAVRSTLIGGDDALHDQHAHVARLACGAGEDLLVLMASFATASGSSYAVWVSDDERILLTRVGTSEFTGFPAPVSVIPMDDLRVVRSIEGSGERFHLDWFITGGSTRGWSTRVTSAWVHGTPGRMWLRAEGMHVRS